MMRMTYNQPIKEGVRISLTVIGAFRVVMSNEDFENSIETGGKLR